MAKRLAGDLHPQQRRGDARHQLRRQVEALGASAGSPGGGAPSGSSCAARCPWLRYALTTDMAAATPSSRSASTVPRRGRAARPPRATAPRRPRRPRRAAARPAGRGSRGRRRRSRPRRAGGGRSPPGRPALGALDDPVVVGAGHRHDLLHAQRAQRLGARRREARRVADGAGGDDRALARHQARHRGHGAEAARVGEPDARAAQLVGLHLAARACGPPGRRRRRGSRGSRRRRRRAPRHQQRAAAVLALHVHRQPHAHAVAHQLVRLAVDQRRSRSSWTAARRPPARWPRRSGG